MGGELEVGQNVCPEWPVSLAAQRLSDFRVGVADWVDEHTLLRRVRRADEAERKDELGTDQVAVPERRLRELTHPVARQQRP